MTHERVEVERRLAATRRRCLISDSAPMLGRQALSERAEKRVEPAELARLLRIGHLERLGEAEEFVNTSEDQDRLVHQLHRSDAGRVLVKDAVGMDRLRAVARAVVLLQNVAGMSARSFVAGGPCSRHTALAPLASHEGIHWVTDRSSIIPAHSEAAEESVSIANLLQQRAASSDQCPWLAKQACPTHKVQKRFRRSLIAIPSGGSGKSALIVSGISFICKPSGVSIL